jgi:tetratricopeptide (TPR) repeat protein
MARRKRRNPAEEPRTPLGIADYHYSVGDYKRAEQEFRDLKDYPGRLANCLRELGRLDEAETYYKSAIEAHVQAEDRDPLGEKDVRLEYARCLSRIGRQPEAEEQKRLAKSLDKAIAEDLMEAVRKRRRR